MRSVIRTEHLDSGYGHKVIVSGAEIVVQPGEIVTLIGPNGAGKSTVLKTIAVSNRSAKRCKHCATAKLLTDISCKSPYISAP